MTRFPKDKMYPPSYEPANREQQRLTSRSESDQLALDTPSQIPYQAFLGGGRYDGGRVAGQAGQPADRRAYEHGTQHGTQHGGQYDIQHAHRYVYERGAQPSQQLASHGPPNMQIALQFAVQYNQNLQQPTKPLNLRVLEETLAKHDTTIKAINGLKEQANQSFARGDYAIGSIYRDLYLKKEQPMYEEVCKGFPKDDIGLLKMFRENAGYYGEIGDEALQQGYIEAATALMNKIHLARQNDAAKTPAAARPTASKSQRQAPPSKKAASRSRQNIDSADSRYMAPAPAARQYSSFADSLATFQPQGSYPIRPLQTSNRIANPHHTLIFFNFTAADFEVDHPHTYYDREAPSDIGSGIDPVAAMHEVKIAFKEHHDPLFTDREMNEFVVKVEDYDDGYTGYGDRESHGPGANRQIDNRELDSLLESVIARHDKLGDEIGKAKTGLAFGLDFEN